MHKLVLINLLLLTGCSTLRDRQISMERSKQEGFNLASEHYSKVLENKDKELNQMHDQYVSCDVKYNKVVNDFVNFMDTCADEVLANREALAKCLENKCLGNK